MEALGSRLKMLRLKAGISQMKLAEILGLNPTHGYKYILRLEKGLVPNPTLRTITGYLNACNAGWQDIAEVLPQIKLTETRSSEPEKLNEPVIVTPYTPESTSATAMLIIEKNGRDKIEISKEKYWDLVQKVIDHTWAELQTSNLLPGSRRSIFTFIRSVCLTITRSQPENLNSRLEQLLNLWEKQVPDKNLLIRVQNLCLEILSRANPTKI